jgi:FkbM family methyltransferase
MNRDRLIIESFRYFHKKMPRRLFAKYKTILLKDDERWGKQGRLPRQLHGNPYWLMLSMKHGAQREAYLRGYWYEIGLNKLMDQQLRPGHIFIDIGANIGIYTLHGAYLVGETGCVIAVEPNPLAFEVVRGHVAINRISNVTLHQLALGNERGTVVLKGCTDDTGFTTARPDFRLDSEEARREVPLETGDTLFQSIPVDAVGLCKIDVEGMEYAVVTGMLEFLATHPMFMYYVEITDDWLKQMGGSAQDIFDLFHRYGFEAYHYVARGDGQFVRLTSPIADQYQYNVLFQQPR